MYKTNPLLALVAAPTIVVAAFLFGVMLVTGGVRPTPLPVASAFPPAIVLPGGAIAAKAAIVYDPATNRVLFAKNPELQLPLASLTKLMTAQVVLSTQSPNTPITIQARDLVQDGDAGDWGFTAGQQFRTGDLVKIGLVASSNDAMAAAAASLGPDYLAQMNQTASKLGLSQTYFLNPTGLDVSQDTSGAYGSAYDVARLAALFYKNYPQYFTLTTRPRVSIKGSDQLAAVATALPLQNMPGFVGAKTGYTDLAGGNLAAVFDIEIGHPLVVVVLGSTQQGRFDDIKTLIDAVRTATH